jgi:hypothetical protein
MWKSTASPPVVVNVQENIVDLLARLVTRGRAGIFSSDLAKAG